MDMAECRMIPSNSFLWKLLLTLLVDLYFVMGALPALIDPMQHEIQIANEDNFTIKVKVPRQISATSVFFYTSHDPDVRRLINKELDAVARELKGIFPVISVNCGETELKKLCVDELGEGFKTPVLRVYPALPFPAYNFQGEFVKQNIKRELVKNVTSKVEIIEPVKMPEFLSKYETMPKALLFSDRDAPSYIYKALSVAFDKKLLLGFVDAKRHQDLKFQYNVKKLPHLIVIKTDSKVDVFKGEFRYIDMFEWLNVYAETFLLGGGYADDSSKLTRSKVWKFDPLPRINLESHMDLCFGKNQGFCIIYLTNGAITASEKKMLVDLSNKYDGQFNGKWMWMDLGVEKEFAELFSTVTNLPSLVIFNPKKRLRYLVFEGDRPISRYDIESLLEKVLGGDARFTIVKGEKLPQFSLAGAKYDEL